MATVRRWTRWLTAVITLTTCAVPSAGGEQGRPDHAAWDALLKQYVNSAGQVNYVQLKTARAVLDGYLTEIAAIDPATLPRADQLAFWVNAYNACVFKGVLDHYPVKSVKDVKGFFDAIRYQVGGASLTLNEIEANGRALGDWRIHFGVVCASSSCPFLRGEAYVPDRVEAQLAEQAMRFLADPARGLRLDGHVLWASKIFKWYAKDFVPNGPLTADALVAVLSPYVDAAHAQTLRRANLTLKFLDYDWSLNAQH